MRHIPIRHRCPGRPQAACQQSDRTCGRWCRERRGNARCAAGRIQTAINGGRRCCRSSQCRRNSSAADGKAVGLQRGDVAVIRFERHGDRDGGVRDRAGSLVRNNIRLRGSGTRRSPGSWRAFALAGIFRSPEAAPHLQPALTNPAISVAAKSVEINLTGLMICQQLRKCSQQHSPTALPNPPPARRWLPVPLHRRFNPLKMSGR